MKFASLVVVVLIFQAAVYAQPLNSQEDLQFEKANRAYQQQDYQAAASLYQAMIDKDLFPAAPVFFNLGNAYYKQGNMGKAVLYYEKALQINPRSREISANLNLARSKTLDRIDSNISFLSAVFVKLFSYVNLNELLGVSWFLTLLFAGMSVGMLHGKGGEKLKTLYYFGIVPLFVVFVAAGSFKYYLYEHVRKGVIVVDKADVKSGPGDTFQTLFTVHDGLKFTCAQDSQSGWSRIELDNGGNGWIPDTTFGQVNPL